MYSYSPQKQWQTAPYESNASQLKCNQVLGYENKIESPPRGISKLTNWSHFLKYFLWFKAGFFSFGVDFLAQKCTTAQQKPKYFWFKSYDKLEIFWCSRSIMLVMRKIWVLHPYIVSLMGSELNTLLIIKKIILLLMLECAIMDSPLNVLLSYRSWAIELVNDNIRECC